MMQFGWGGGEDSVIAEMGNRGNSTGPHLHFEVWTPDGQKINPQPWLLKHGITL